MPEEHLPIRPVRIGDEPYPDDQDDGIDEHRATLARDLQRAEAAALDAQIAGDRITDQLEMIHALTPPLADTEEWWEVGFPATGVDMAQLRDTLQSAVVQVYAIGGAYRRAADRLRTALAQLDVAVASEAADCAFPGDQEHDHEMCRDAVADAGTPQ